MDVFQDHLEQDDETEVVKVRRGYLVLEWDSRGGDYQFMDLCETPKQLLDCLLGAVHSYYYIKYRNLETDYLDDNIAKWIQQLCKELQQRAMQ